MTVPAYTRVGDLGSLPCLITKAGGTRALERMFQSRDLPVSMLDSPDGLMLYSDWMAFYHYAAVVTNERSLGLRVGCNLPFRDMGLVAQYIMSAPNLRQALDRLVKNVQYHESFTKIDVTRDGDDVKVLYTSLEQGKTGWRQAADVVLCVLVDLVRHFAGKRWCPSRIEVSYPRGAWAQDLEDHFGVQILFDQPSISIAFDPAWLESESSETIWSPGLLTILDLKRQINIPPRTFTGVIQEVLHQRLMYGKFDLDGVAARIGIGPRTLQRRLSDEGITYGAMLEQVRRHRAIDLILEGTSSFAEIAVALGYSSHSQFSRAFKKWEGRTPEETRGGVRPNRL